MTFRESFAKPYTSPGSFGGQSTNAVRLSGGVLRVISCRVLEMRGLKVQCFPVLTTDAIPTTTETMLDIPILLPVTLGVQAQDARVRCLGRWFEDVGTSLGLRFKNRLRKGGGKTKQRKRRIRFE